MFLSGRAQLEKQNHNDLWGFGGFWGGCFAFVFVFVEIKPYTTVEEVREVKV